MDHIKSVYGSCDSPTFCFPSHPLLFILIIPVDSQVLITVSSTLAVYLVSLPPVGLSFQSACYSTAVLMLLPIFRYSLALHLLMASLARLMSKLFSRPQSSLWHNHLVMRQTRCLLKEPCACLAVSDPLRPHRLESARLLCLWVFFPGRNTGVSCHSLL